jgi:septal ring factor EnvC (AmiA/AmiB activator)
MHHSAKSFEFGLEKIVGFVGVGSAMSVRRERGGRAEPTREVSSLKKTKPKTKVKEPEIAVERGDGESGGESGEDEKEEDNIDGEKRKGAKKKGNDPIAIEKSDEGEKMSKQTREEMYGMIMKLEEEMANLREEKAKKEKHKRGENPSWSLEAHEAGLVDNDLVNTGIDL